MSGTLYWWRATPVKTKRAIYFEADCENAAQVAKTASGGAKCKMERLDQRPPGLLQQITVEAHFSAPANPLIAETRSIPIYIEGML